MNGKPLLLLVLLAMIVLGARAIKHQLFDSDSSTSQDSDKVTSHPESTSDPEEARSAVRNRPATRKLSEEEQARPAIKRYVREKLDRTIFPIVDFDNATIEESLDYFRLRLRELDPDPDEAGKGLSFIIKQPSVPVTAKDFDGGADALEADASQLIESGLDSIRISGKARNISAADVLSLISKEAGMNWKISDHGIILEPLNTKAAPSP